MPTECEVILDAARRAGGFIDQPTIAELLPDSSPSQRRASVSRLLARQALVSVRAAGVPGSLYLTTTGRGSGVGMLPPAPRAAALAGERPVVQPDVTVKHDLIAARLAIRFGETWMLPRDLARKGGTKRQRLIVSDGRAFRSNGEVWNIEVERMVNQGVERWKHASGLVDKILDPCCSKRPKATVLAVTPRTVGRVQDAARWLQAEASSRLAYQYRWRYADGMNPRFYWLDVNSLDDEPQLLKIDPPPDITGHL